ncbi:hypothetical protein GCM10011611_20210 [Aliidongia dinghuensis]|uniref:histidine kinase n=1 Tax=Aliidongia dinghuensis TaxID=1867774 RepID=A0A8J3E2Z8_9PROT|nr:ATP-binding protein [Aliidongia dinghuensis]GGF14371.1 hypothetical protein GCM10011611_20210 [Aliidongia dinghuensis]
MPRSFRARDYADGAVLLTLIATCALGARYSHDGLRASQAAGRAEQAIAALHRIQSNTTDLETAEREFLLTGDLQNFRPDVAAQVRDDAGRLDGMVAGDLRGRATLLVQATRGELDALAGATRLARTVDPTAALALLRDSSGHAPIDIVRQQSDELLALENQRLADDQRQAELSESGAIGCALIAVVLGIASAASAFAIIRRELARRRRATAEIQQLREIADLHSTELEEARRAIVEAKEQLDRAEQAKASFLATAGHDLRQPLQVIAMAVEQLERQAGEAGAKNGRRAQAAVTFLDRAFSQFSEAARLTSGTIVPDRQMVALGSLIAEICDQLEPLATGKQLRLRCVASSVFVETDPAMLATILRNLIGNAIKYTNSGGVLVGVRRRHNGADLQVYDTGCGIAACSIPRIFDDYRQLEPGAGGGVGLGLSIVRRTSQILGCTVSVRSELHRGSCFTIRLANGRKNFGAIDASGARPQRLAARENGRSGA